MASQKHTVLYARLSQEDEHMGESNSIHNQRILLEKYAAERGFENTIFLSDDGYTGTNFERPSWKKFIAMVEADEVQTLIVKDMSRLGREYLQVGHYTEIYLPEKGVRFIAVNDGVDSLVESSNDFNPIRNWANELHAKDTSKKVRSVKKLQAERGERLGGAPPYGYRVREDNHKFLAINEETAPTVRRIFQEGKGPTQIARTLRDEQILNPSHYYYRQTGKAAGYIDLSRPYGWSATTIVKMLGNPVYLGHTRALCSTTISYKNKKRVDLPKEKQVLVEHTHEPLISQEIWDTVQRVRQHKRRPPKHMEEPNLFAGLVFCVDCGLPLFYCRTEKMKSSQYYFRCRTYSKLGKTACTPHQILERDLKAIVLDDLRRVTHFARMKEKQFAAYIDQKNSFELRREITALQKELDAMQRRAAELNRLFKRLYEDNVLGRVTDEQFRLLAADYNAEQKTLESAIPEKATRLQERQAAAANLYAFIEKAQRYTTIGELTPELLWQFIQRIEIGERSKKHSQAGVQSIRIVYRDIGTVDSAMEADEKPPHLAPPIEESIELLQKMAYQPKLKQTKIRKQADRFCCPPAPASSGSGS